MQSAILGGAERTSLSRGVFPPSGVPDQKNCQTKGDGYITFCPAKGIFKRKIEYAPGIDGAYREMNALRQMQL